MTSDPPFRRRSRRLLPGEPSDTSEAPGANADRAHESLPVPQRGERPESPRASTQKVTDPGREGTLRPQEVAEPSEPLERPKRTIIGLGLAPRPDLVAKAAAAGIKLPEPPTGNSSIPSAFVVGSPDVLPTAPRQDAALPTATSQRLLGITDSSGDAALPSHQLPADPAVPAPVLVAQEEPAPAQLPLAGAIESSSPPGPLAAAEASRRKSRRVLGSNAELRESASAEVPSRLSAAGATTARSESAPPHVEPLPLSKAPRGEGRFPIVTIVKWIGVTLGLLFLVAFVVAFVAVRRYAEDLPSVEDLKAGYNPPQITRIVAREGTLLATEFTERRTVIPFEQIPNAAKLAFLAAEDASFYEHEGINYLGLGRAVFANLRAGKAVQGGSTITQQVVKNVLLDSSRSLRRKVREFLLALRLERSLTKDEIFWLYLNHIYLGHGRYGIEEAARYYFGKRALELGLDEASVLAGITASPENYSPRRDADKALKRRRFVVGQMLAKGFVTQAVHDHVMEMPLRLAPTTESESRLAPEIVHKAKEVMDQVLGDQKSKGGYTVHTTIDPELQAAGRQAVRTNLDRYMDRHKLVAPYKATEIKAWGPAFKGKPHRNKVYVGVVEKADDLAGVLEVRVGDVVGQVSLSTETRYNPSGLPPSEFAVPGALLRVSLVEEPVEDAKVTLRLELGPQSALVAIDVRSLEVLASVGSYEAIAGGLDRVTQMKRQPGSSFKPIVYSYALHSRRFTPATVIPVATAGHGVPAEGPLSIDVRAAVAHSNNEAAEIVLQQSGVDNVVDWARALGIESRLRPDLSLALGSYEVTPLELLGAYVAFASGGTVRKAKFVNRIADGSGVDLSLPPMPAETAVLTAEEAYLTTSLLRTVVESGTGRAAAKLQREVAGKTGTTNESKDTWFVGYSTDIACAVWVGYDDGLPLGKSESGATTALPAWIEFMDVAHKKRPHTRFVRPASILAITVDPVTGLLAGPGQANARMEEFLPGTEPTEIAPPPEPPSTEAAPSATLGSETQNPTLPMDPR
jgi:penicillin-binding protein 1A